MLQYTICTKCFKSEEGKELSRFCPCGYMRKITVVDTAATERINSAPLSRKEIEELLWSGTAS